MTDAPSPLSTWWVVVDAKQVPGVRRGMHLLVDDTETGWVFRDTDGVPVASRSPSETAKKQDGQFVTFEGPGGSWILLLPPDAKDARNLPTDLGGIANGPLSLVRTYKGDSQEEASRLFERDARRLAPMGYAPVAQTWAAGQWSTGAFLGALLLGVLLIGFLVFLYMLIVKPEGTLTVTYAKRPPEASKTEPGQGLSLTDRLRQLDEAKGIGLITDDEYRAKKSDLLDRL